jgi:ABC-type maltose transport system permease subunit
LSRWSLRAAAATIVAAFPQPVLGLLVQKRIVRGLTMGGAINARSCPAQSNAMGPDAV